MQNSRRKFIVDILYSFIPVSVNKLSSLLYLPLIFKYAGVVAYGIWQQFGLSAQVLLHLGTMNVGVGLKKYLPQKSDQEEISRLFYSTLVWVAIFSVSISGILWLGRRPLGALLFTEGPEGTLILLLSLYIPLEALLNELNNVLRALRRVKVIAIMGPVRVIAKLVTVSLSLTVFHTSIEQAIANFLVSEFVVFLLLLGVLWYHIGLRSIRLDLSSSFQFISYGLPFVLAGISTWSSAFSDRFFLLHFHGIDTVGMYSGAYVLASIPLLFVNPICQILLPDLSALLGLGKRRQATERASRVLFIYGVICGLLSTIMVIVGPVLLAWLGKEPLGTDDSIIFVLALALGAYGLLTLQSSILTAFLGRAHFNWIWVGLAIGNIFLNLSLIPQHEMLGAAIASLTTYALGCVAMGVLLKGNLRTRYLGVVFALIGFGVFLGAVLSKYVAIEGKLVQPVVTAILGAGLYVGVILVLFRKQLSTITREEQE